MPLSKKIVRENGRIDLGLTCEGFYTKTKKDRKRIRVNETQARKILLEEGYLAGKVKEKQTLDNKAGITETKFVFEDNTEVAPEPPAKTTELTQPPSKTTELTPQKENADTPTLQPKTRKRRGRKTQENLEKTQKNLDNSGKDVIIRETITEE